MSSADPSPKTMYELTLRKITRLLGQDDYFDIEEPHNYLMVEFGTDVELLMDAKPPVIEMPRGVGYQYPPDQSVQRVRVYSRNVFTQNVTVYYGRGNIIDQRLQFAGALEVTNAAGTCLAVKNCPDEPLGLKARIDEISLSAGQDVIAELGKSLLTPIGGSNFTRSTVGTGDIVTAAANVNGLILNYGLCTGGNLATGAAAVYMTGVGAGAIMQITNVVAGSPAYQQVRDLWIPAGTSLSYNLVGVGSSCTVQYKLL